MLWAGAGAREQSQATLLSPGWVKPEQYTDSKGHRPFLKTPTHRFSGPDSGGTLHVEEEPYHSKEEDSRRQEALSGVSWETNLRQ